MMKRLLALLLCSITLCSTALAQNIPGNSNARNMPREAEYLRGRILEGALARAGVREVQAWLNGPLADEAGITAEWYVLALSGEGYDLSAYQAALRQYLAEHTVRSATTRMKYAMALLASGASADDPAVTAILAESAGQQGLMSWVWGLHLLNNGVPGPIPAEEAISTLLSLQFEDGGWALNGTKADVDVTAMTLQALAPHRDRADVQSAIDRAVALLSARQQPDGGFTSYGVPNPESAAQVLTALSALNINALTDARFIRNGATLLDGITPYLLADGSLSHTLGGPGNHNATTQVFLALTAWQRFLDGRGSIYLLDIPETTPVPEIAPGVMTAQLDGNAIAALCIAGGAGLLCLLLLITGKRHWKNFLAVGLIAALAIVFVLTTRFQAPDDYYSVTAVTGKGDAIGAVTMSIRCDTVAGRADHIPADGVILPETAFPIAEGDTVYTVLTEAARAHRIQLEGTGGPGLVYVAGMAYLYEQAFGDLSGWLYTVNGETHSVGCDQYVLQPGDVVQWAYTLNMGSDLK